MKYKNVRTGAVINTSGKISGDNWVEISVAPAQSEVEKKAENAVLEKATVPIVKKTASKPTAKKPVAKKTTSRK